MLLVRMTSIQWSLHKCWSMLALHWHFNPPNNLHLDSSGGSLSVFFYLGTLCISNWLFKNNDFTFNSLRKRKKESSLTDACSQSTPLEYPVAPDAPREMDPYQPATLLVSHHFCFDIQPCSDPTRVVWYSQNYGQEI